MGMSLSNYSVFSETDLSNTMKASLLGAAFTFAFTGVAFAAAITTGEFGPAQAKIIGIISGAGGATAASVSLGRQLIKNSMQFQGVSVMEPLGVGLMATLGGAAISGLFTALI